MIHRIVRIAAAATILLAGMTRIACAEPLEAKLAVSLDVLSGDHEIALGRRDNLHWVPLPLGELTLRRGADSLRVEGMPPVSSTYGTGGTGTQNPVRLSILNATYRRDLGHGWFAGAGQTVYNQGSARRGPGSLLEQYSRITGARWEIGRIAASGRDRLEAWASFNPVMHGVGHRRLLVDGTCFGSPAPVFCVSPFDATTNDAESAGQIDVSARVAHRMSTRGELLLGVRYLNYSARFDQTANIADRNVGFAPTIGYRTRI